MRREPLSLVAGLVPAFVGACVLLVGCAGSSTEGTMDAAGAGGAGQAGSGPAGASGTTGAAGGAGVSGSAGAVGTGGASGGGGAISTGGTGATAGTGGTAGTAGAAGGIGGSGGSLAGRGGSTAGAGGGGGSGGTAGTGNARGGAGGSTGGGTGGTTGGSGGTGGSSARGGAGGGAGGAAGTGGSSAGRGGTTGSAGSNACGSIASTSTRPQLSSTEAANYTIAKYLAGSDNWDPTAGLGAASSFTPNFTVASDGSGTHTTVQAAVTAAASGSTRRYILVKPGTYRGSVSISGSTPLTIYGADTDATRVVIVDNKSASSAGGTGQSATFTSKANGLQLMNLTVSNDFATPMTGSNIQAVALYVTGDKTVLQNVRMHGFQDTLFTDTASETTPSRVYMKGCYVEGDTDFIFGGASLVIDGGTINYISTRKGSGSGACLAPSTRVSNNYGFLVIGCNFTADSAAPANKTSLGRSWDEGGPTPTPNGQAVVRESTLGAHIRKVDPWAAAATSGRAYSATGNRFDEYCNSGPGAGP